MLNAQTKIRPREGDAKSLWDFEIQTDHLILVRRPELVLSQKNKRIYHLIDFAVRADHRMKIKGNEKINEYLDLAKRTEKTVEHHCDGDTNCGLCAWNSPKRLGKRLEELEIRGRSKTI